MDTRKKAAALKRQLTELSVRKLKPRKTAYLIWDLQQRGLAIRMQPSGNKAWKVIYSRLGRPRWYHIGDAGAIGLSDARTLAARVKLAVAEGKDPAAERRAERGSGTFAELAAKYVTGYAKKQNKSWRQAEHLVQRYVLPRWAKLQATSITRSDVKAMLSQIEARPVLANQVLASASAVFTWAIKEEILIANPCKLVDRNQVVSRERVLAESEVPRFWSGFDDAGLVASSALKVILLTGQRPGEVSHMRREHIKDGFWELPGEPDLKTGWPGTKNAENHRLWLPKPVQAIIAKLGEGATGFVFNVRNRPVTGLDGGMRAICSKLGIERATPHDLRRTHGTTITAMGFGRDAMNRIQNHTDGGIGSVYDRHGYADENRRVMEAVANKIMSLVDGQPDDKVVPFRR